MTLPAINSSENVVFLVSGRDKAGILKDVLEGDSEAYPAGLVRPISNEVIWLVDEDAASLLKDSGRLRRE